MNAEKTLNTQKKKILEIDSLKGFAICFVILGHAIIKSPVNLHDNQYCQWLFDFVSSVHLCAFFAVSGFCFSYKGDFKDFIKKKFLRILLPYFCFSLLDLIPRIFLPSLVNRQKGILKAVTDIFIYGGSYWFLFALFLMFLIYVPLHLLQKNKIVIQIVLEIVLLILSLFEFTFRLFAIDRVIYYLFFFNSGYLVKKYCRNIFDFNISSKILKITVPVVMLAVWVICVIFFNNTYTRSIIGVWGIITVFFFSRFGWFNFIFARFGEYSLQLYLFNGFLLGISRYLICKVTSDPFIIISFNMIVDFYLSYLFIKYLWSKVKFLRIISGMELPQSGLKPEAQSSKSKAKRMSR